MLQTPQSRITARQIATYVIALAIALSVGIVAWLLMNHFISNATPWNWDVGISYGWIKSDTPLPLWFIHAREDTRKVARLIAITMALATLVVIPLLLGIVKKQRRPADGFEILLGLCPLLSFLPSLPLAPICIFFIPIPFVAALLVSIQALRSRGPRRNIWVFPITVCWLALFLWYGVNFWGMIGD